MLSSMISSLQRGQRVGRKMHPPLRFDSFLSVLIGQRGKRELGKDRGKHREEKQLRVAVGGKGQEKGRESVEDEQIIENDSTNDN